MSYWVNLILWATFTNVPGVMLLLQPERCWYVQTSGDEFGTKIVATLQQNYSPIILTKEYDDKCDGFIYIDKSPKEMLKLLYNIPKNYDKKRKNAKLMLIYYDDVDFVLEDSVLKYLHYKSLNVLMVRIHNRERLSPNHLLALKISFDSMSVTAPFINKTKTVTTADVSPMKQLYKLQKWRPDFSALLNITFRVGINMQARCIPYLINGTNYKEGIEIKIIREVSKRWKIEFHEYVSNAPWNASFNKLNEDTIDIGTCLQFLHQDIDVDLTHPYARVCATFLVPKPLPVNPSEYLYLPLSTNVWIGVAVFSVVSFLSMYFIAVAGYKTDQSQWADSPYQTFTTCMWNTFTILTSQGAAVCPNQNSLRVFIMAWILVCLLVSVGYCTGYASLLTYPRFTKRISTMGDIVEQGLYWGTNMDFTSTIKILIDDVNSPLHPGLKKSFLPENNKFDRFERLKGGHYAMISTTLKNKFVSAVNLQNVSRTLEVLSGCHDDVLKVFPLQKNSPYTEIFNEKILQITESGIIDTWLTDISFKNNLSYMKNFFSHDVEPNDVAPLILNDLQGAFYLLSLGLILSAGVFLYEQWKSSSNYDEGY